jgi:predicted transcriptional regulator
MKSVFEEYLSCVAECFGEAYDDRNYSDIATEKRDTSLRAVCEEFHISIPKARKLLITAGVYSTEKSRTVAELTDQGKSATEIMALTGLSRSSVSSYLPYQKFSYNMTETSRHAEDSRKYRERKHAVAELCKAVESGAEADDILWQAVIAYQNYPFYTSSGLPFSYTVKCKKNGDFSGELIVSRKEGSKTLTRSSVMLAFHKVLDSLKITDSNADGEMNIAIVPPEYKGPKAIGQIFGISYVYSMFWKWGLITVPRKVEEKLKGKN